ncbi:MAG: 23S rRNA (pseudouridine(1915)-N(3))-methyltransferase RlmH [Muribaculaceae bacterium]|nr:23S rRNA (pseudouridine(1915)-N(3))-methyltransferase RlmH [Muribaculaceae bacterium]
MKILILAVGRTSTDYIKRATDDYVKRISHYMPVEFRTLADVKGGKGMTEQQQKEREGALILESVSAADRVVLLDERGVVYTSRRFAEELQQRMLQGLKRLVFVIGGPYGFSKAVYDRADATLSLSAMTFSHEMIRLFFAEQVYRAMTILRGEPYHHD